MKRFSIVSVFSLFYFFSYAQDAPFEKIVPVSPQAASLGKFLEIPVGNYTGIPGTDIPVYTVQSREISVPISLNYHGGGIKVSEVASDVGLGWTLNAGGSIIQQTRGLADQFAGGFLENSAIVRDFNSYSPQKMRDIAENVLDLHTLDTEPDIFYYSFNGKSGKLFFGTDGKSVHTIPRSNIIAKYIPGVNSSWEITAEDGFKYIFAAEEVSESVTLENPAKNISSSWYLTEIISPNSTDVVKFRYRSENFKFTGINSSTAYPNPSGGIGEGCPIPQPSTSRNYTTTNGLTLDLITFSSGKVKFIPQTTARLDMPGAYALNSIEIYDNNDVLIRKVDLGYSYSANESLIKKGDITRRLFLDQVKFVDLSSKVNHMIYGFQYESKNALPAYDSYSQDHWGYFNAAANTTTGFVPTTILTNFNNQPYTYNGADRNPSSLALAGTLIKVELPTGGTHEFEYEPNKITGRRINITPIKYKGGASIHAEPDKKEYELPFTIDSENRKIEITFKNGPLKGQGAPGPVGRITGPDNYSLSLPYPEINKTFTLPKKGQYNFSVDFNNWPEYVDKFQFNIQFLADEGDAVRDTVYQNEVVGGVRILRVLIKNPDSQNTIIKKYLYSDLLKPALSSGSLVSIPHYVNEVDLARNYDELNNANCEIKRISSFSNSTLTTTGGSFVGYRHVIELLGENGENGKNEYFYTSPSIIPDKVGSWPYNVTSREHHRGKLTEELNYKFEDKKFVLVKQIQNLYTDKGLQIFPAIKFSGDAIYSRHNIPYVIGGIKANYTFYDTETDYYDLTTQITIVNNVDNQSIKTIEDYTYNDSNQLIKVESRDSKNNLNTQISYYPSEMVAKGVMSPYQEMINRNMLNTIIEKEKQLNNISLEKNITVYTTGLADNDQLILPSEIQTKFKEAAADTRWRYNRYNDQGSPLNVSKEKGVRINYLWSYNGQYPIAEIKGCDYVMIANKLGVQKIKEFSNLINPDLNTINTFLAPLLADQANLEIVIYSYKPLIGMVSQTDAKGQTTYFEYDGFQRLKNVKDQNGNIIKNNTYHYTN